MRPSPADSVTVRLRVLIQTLRAKWLAIALLGAFVWVMVPLVGGFESTSQAIESVQKEITTLREMANIRIQSEDQTRGQISEIRENLRAAVENIRFLKERMDRIEDGDIGGDIGRGADANAFIEAELQSLLTRFSARRVYIFQKHDGRTNSAGNHLWFYSMTHEVVAAGASREAPSYQTLPESLFTRYDLELERRMVVEDAMPAGKPAHADDWIHRAMQERGAQRVIAVPLFSATDTTTSGGQLIGFVGMDFQRATLDIKMEFMRPFLYRTAIAIMGALLR